MHRFAECLLCGNLYFCVAAALASSTVPWRLLQGSHRLGGPSATMDAPSDLSQILRRQGWCKRVGQLSMSEFWAVLSSSFKLFLAVFKFLILWSLCWPVSVLRGVQKSLCLGLCLFVDVSEKSTALLLGIQKLHREVQEAPADHWCLASLSGRFPCVKMLHADYGSYMLVWHASTKPEALPRRGT